MIPIHEPLRVLLSTHPKVEGSPYVFPGRDGRKRVDLKKSLRRSREAAALPDGFRPLHGLRHTYASMLASSGEVDPFILQRLLTHKSPVMTQRYAHLRDEALRRAAKLAGALVEKIVNSGAEEPDYLIFTKDLQFDRFGVVVDTAIELSPAAEAIKNRFGLEVIADPFTEVPKEHMLDCPILITTDDGRRCLQDSSLTRTLGVISLPLLRFKKLQPVDRTRTRDKGSFRFFVMGTA